MWQSDRDLEYSSVCFMQDSNNQWKLQKTWVMDCSRWQWSQWGCLASPLWTKTLLSGAGVEGKHQLWSDKGTLSGSMDAVYADHVFSFCCLGTETLELGFHPSGFEFSPYWNASLTKRAPWPSCHHASSPLWEWVCESRCPQVIRRMDEGSECGVTRGQGAGLEKVGWGEINFKSTNE